MVRLFAGSMSHGHQGIIIDCLAQATAICPSRKTLDLRGTEQELKFAAESMIHIWFPITIPNNRFLIAQLQSCQKYLGQQFSFTWCFKQLQVLQRSLNYLFGGIKHCKWMVNLRYFPFMVHCLDWSHIMTPVLCGKNDNIPSTECLPCTWSGRTAHSLLLWYQLGL